MAVGFEHRVANTALFSLAILDGSVGFGDLFRNLMFIVPGNVVGGSLLVGAGVPGHGRVPARERSVSLRITFHHSASTNKVTLSDGGHQRRPWTPLVARRLITQQ
ncbi:hypothetical protein [Streptomyces sp. NPDC058701]|uniref:hypothetical protein n=1 Tax=Streptomyces sp. NPDC058701 TaxID=3346608 RepID=UPI003667F13E